MSLARRLHSSPLGRVVLYLGSVRFAVPLLALIAAAMIWGTFLDASQGARVAGRIVYGSWWFIALMALVCLTLIIAVALRYPFKRKHIGFIVVHASLITLIATGFATYFFKIEGEILLNQGGVASAIRTGDRRIELFEHNDGSLGVIESVDLDSVDVASPKSITLGSTTFRVIEDWANTVERVKVVNDGARQLHAVELTIEPGAPEAHWVGQTAPGEPPPRLAGMTIRVIPQGEVWSPPQGDERLVLLTDQGEELDLPEAGTRIGDSRWQVQQVQRFAHAVVSSDGLIEGDPDRANPAIEMLLEHEDGSRERLTAFSRFPDSPMKRTVAGERVSPYRVAYMGARLTSPTLALMLDGDRRWALFASPEGMVTQVEHDGSFPWTIQCGEQTVTVLADLDRARADRQLVEAPAENENRPAMILEVDTGDHQHQFTLVWGQRTPVEIDGVVRILKYGPATHALPFSIELVEFRKTDYPGSQMAMAYESEVVMRVPGAEPIHMTIWMNHPLKHAGWKVYQSGFLGDGTTILAVTKDPGLVPTYLACTGLCVGIMITFFSRSMSSGHPGIPVAFKRRNGHAMRGNQTHSSTCDAAGGRPVEGVVARADGQGVGVIAGTDRDPVSRPDDADGHLRAPHRGRSHRPHQVV